MFDQNDCADARVDQLNWSILESQLEQSGYLTVRNLLSAAECDQHTAAYEQSNLYRSRIEMARYSFGKGEYKYYGYPLPAPIQALRNSLYPHLAKIANNWNRKLEKVEQFPEEHKVYIDQCHASSQKRPTPLILKYKAGDYNCLHQDLYGDMVFPLQAVIMLNEPGEDFDGGEFILTEQRPRMQSRAEIVPLGKGDIAIFPVNERPVKGKRGYYRTKMRHGVSRVREGNRHVLGIIFHDAA